MRYPAKLKGSVGTFIWEIVAVMGGGTGLPTLFTAKFVVELNSGI